MTPQRGWFLESFDVWLYGESVALIVLWGLIGRAKHNILDRYCLSLTEKLLPIVLPGGEPSIFC